MSSSGEMKMSESEMICGQAKVSGAASLGGSTDARERAQSTKAASMRSGVSDVAACGQQQLSDTDTGEACRVYALQA